MSINLLIKKYFEEFSLLPILFASKYYLKFFDFSLIIIAAVYFRNFNSYQKVNKFIILFDLAIQTFNNY